MIGFTFLTAPAGADFAHLAQRELIAIQAIHWGSWLDPAKDTRAQQQAAPEGTFALHQLPAARGLTAA